MLNVLEKDKRRSNVTNRTMYMVDMFAGCGGFH